MACNLTTKLASACTSGIGKLSGRLQLLRVWAQLLCEDAGCVAAPDAPVLSDPAPVATTYTITWNAVPGATIYLLDLAEPGFVFYVFENEPVEENSFIVNDVGGASREARVRAVNACGVSDYSNTVAFSVP